MKKKQKQLVALLIVLFVCVGLFFGTKKFSDKEENTTETEKTITETPLLTLEEGDYVTSVSLINEENNISFSYDASNGWTWDENSEFPVSSTNLETLLDSVTGISYLREISNADNLSDYGLDAAVLTLSFNTANGVSKTYKFSETTGVENTYYFLDADTNTVYMTATSQLAYAESDVFDFADIAQVPLFETLNVTNVDITQAGGEVINIVGSESEETEEELYLTIESLNYYISSKGETEADLKAFDEDDATDFKTMLTEFVYNGAVCFDPTDEELSSYGLSNPATKMTVTFKTTAIDTETVTEEASENVEDATFTYTISIGNETFAGSGEYYVFVDCYDTINKENSTYNCNFVLTMNSSYAEYFLELTEDSINGVNSNTPIYLGENEIPAITTEAINYIIVNNANGTYKLTYTDEGVYYDDLNTVEEETNPVSTGTVSQLAGYLFSSGYLAYNMEYGSARNEDTLAECGITTESTTLTVAYDAEYTNDEGVTTEDEVVWTLIIGNRGAEEYFNDDLEQEIIDCYYVTASNSEYVFTMDPTIGDYVNAITSGILDGTETYGDSEATELNY